MASERLGETLLADVPTTPGVYLMFGLDHELLYVGKAKNLRTRLRSYARHDRPDKVLELVAAIDTIRWEQWPTEAAARERETTLLRALRPPYNDTHTDRGDYLYLTASAGDRGRTLLTMTASPTGDRTYGCFPFAAAVTDAFPALIRVLCLAHGRRPPARATKSAGYAVRLEDELPKALDAFLSGRSPRLVTLLTARLSEVDELTARSVRRDLATLRRFYADGPRALRRLRRRHARPAGLTTPDELHELVAAQLRVDLGVDFRVRPRAEVEQRIWAMYADGHGPARIAAALNAEAVPRFGGGEWSVPDVDRVVRGGGDRARCLM